MGKHSLDGVTGFAGRKEHFLFFPGDIVVDGSNTRTYFNHEKLTELKAHVVAGGIVPPLVLRFGADGTMILVAGERRLRAVNSAIQEGSIPKDYAVPITLADSKKKPMSVADMICLNMAENSSEPLIAMDEAKGYERLEATGMSVQDIANRVGKSHTHVYNRLKLVSAEPETVKALETGEITVKEAVKIAQVEPGKQGKALVTASTEKAAKTETRGRPKAEVKAAVPDASRIGPIGPPATTMPPEPAHVQDNPPTEAKPKSRRMSWPEIEKEIRNMTPMLKKGANAQLEGMMEAYQDTMSHAANQIKNLVAMDPESENEHIQGAVLAYKNVLGIKE